MVAQTELARTGKVSREFDDDRSNGGGGTIPARPASSPATAAAAPEGGKQQKAPRQERKSKSTKGKNKAKNEDKNENASKRARLALAFETARGEAEKRSAEKSRAEAEADSALILVGALTAGDWTLAIEACYAARAVYKKVAEETVPELLKYREEFRLFQHLGKIMLDAKHKLDASRREWEAVNRGGDESDIVGNEQVLCECV